MAGVMLGMPGAWADSNYEEADIYSTKIGGLPDWPFPALNMSLDVLKCTVCRSNLCLLAQVHAPITAKSVAIDERVIYVFGCLVPDCKSIVWKAVRVQRILTRETVHDQMHSVSVSDNNHLADIGTFDNSEMDELGEAEDLDLDELISAFTEAATISCNVPKKENCSESSKKLTRDRPARSVDDGTPVLPCFYIYSQEEKYNKKIVAPEDAKCPSLAVPELYGNFEDEPDGETYAEEVYEYDKALHADRTYLKFKKRIDAYPEQCIRYSYGGEPLLPSGEMVDPGICNTCGGARHFEMQLMSPLIYFLQEAADDQLQTSLEKIDWMTLLIFTCSTSCSDSCSPFGGSDWIVAEEAILVQHE